MTSSSKTNPPNFKRKIARMSVKYPTYVNLTSSSEEQPNERTPSPPLRKKSLSPPQVPSKSISSKSTHYTSSSSPNDTLSRYKARLVANGSTQLEGIDVDENFSLVAKPASYETLLRRIVASLHQEFSMTDLGSLNYFLGISVIRDSSRMFLSQHKYATEILKRVYMVNCNPDQTLVDTQSKLGDSGD
ncbi:ribonuclease H-like domain-containing protein [Tanacetum coccineum]